MTTWKQKHINQKNKIERFKSNGISNSKEKKKMKDSANRNLSGGKCGSKHEKRNSEAIVHTRADLNCSGAGTAV